MVWLSLCRHDATKQHRQSLWIVIKLHICWILFRTLDMELDSRILKIEINLLVFFFSPPLFSECVWFSKMSTVVSGHGQINRFMRTIRIDSSMYVILSPNHRFFLYRFLSLYWHSLISICSAQLLARTNFAESKLDSWRCVMEISTLSLSLSLFHWLSLTLF